MFTDAHGVTTSGSTPTRNAGGYYNAAGEPQKEDRDIKYQKALLRVRPLTFVMPRWVLYSLRKDALEGALEESFTGSTIKHFPRQSVLEYRLPLPPLAEQRRVVEKVEALLALVDATRERVQRIGAVRPPRSRAPSDGSQPS